jgi:hypothetical protein
LFCPITLDLACLTAVAQVMLARLLDDVVKQLSHADSSLMIPLIMRLFVFIKTITYLANADFSDCVLSKFCHEHGQYP